MSRHGYIDDWDGDDDNLANGRWRGRVASAIRGKRGQKLLKEMIDAMDAMPDKRLISKELVQDGERCALGCVAVARGLDVSQVDPEVPEQVAEVFGVAEVLVREIAFENDGWGGERETPEQRFVRMRKWAERKITKPAEPLS